MEINKMDANAEQTNYNTQPASNINLFNASQSIVASLFAIGHKNGQQSLP
jgi:hypothetical protein